jgi:hypothetical protein
MLRLVSVTISAPNAKPVVSAAMSLRFVLKGDEARGLGRDLQDAGIIDFQFIDQTNGHLRAQGLRLHPQAETVGCVLRRVDTTPYAQWLETYAIDHA